MHSVPPTGDSDEGIKPIRPAGYGYNLPHHAPAEANQQETISFKASKLRDFFPRHYTAAQMMQEIILSVKERQQRLARQRNRDAR